MRKLFLHVFIAFTTFFFSFGLTKLFDHPKTTAPPAERSTVYVNVVDTSQDEQELREIYRQYGPAQTNHDRVFFERVESERFILFDYDGNLTREQDIREMESWPKGIVYESEVESIRIEGDTAIVTGRMHARSADGGYDSFSYIDVCVRDGDSWQILSTTSGD